MFTRKMLIYVKFLLIHAKNMKKNTLYISVLVNFEGSNGSSSIECGKKSLVCIYQQ